VPVVKLLGVASCDNCARSSRMALVEVRLPCRRPDVSPRSGRERGDTVACGADEHSSEESSESAALDAIAAEAGRVSLWPSEERPPPLNEDKSMLSTNTGGGIRMSVGRTP